MPFVKVVQGIILSALWMPGLLAPAFAQTMEQSLYRQAHEAVRANDQVKFSQLRARLIHYPLLPYLDYYQLAFRPGAADYNDVTRFIRQHGDTPSPTGSSAAISPILPRASSGPSSCVSIRPSQAPPTCSVSTIRPATTRGTRVKPCRRQASSG